MSRRPCDCGYGRGSVCCRLRHLQTEGEPLPALDTGATGDAGDAVGLSRILGGQYAGSFQL
ncbi:hypothetical protein EO776_15855 (plasmid) [Halorubrum ezzemoulense]|uniref:Uncharacterized protein n=1 Tax=Halorubrum ezzemoulense TaxID=337243 RepID=A0A481RJQ5_HALEZ|nr:hypothetical protein EO776_15855 [Halorubrum ezzemoulense]